MPTIITSGVPVQYDNKVVRITNDSNLRDLLSGGNSNVKYFAETIKNNYHYFMQKSLNISAESLAVEIYGHVYPGILFSMIQNANVPQSAKDFVARLSDRTAVIDCGESDVDSNRWVWDTLAFIF